MDEIEVKATPKFMRLARKLVTKEALQNLIDALVLDPEKGDIIKGTGGIRKIRSKTRWRKKWWYSSAILF